MRPDLTRKVLAVLAQREATPQLQAQAPAPIIAARQQAHTRLCSKPALGSLAATLSA